MNIDELADEVLQTYEKIIADRRPGTLENEKEAILNCMNDAVKFVIARTLQLANEPNQR
jgi:hypothetical protein